MTFEELSRQLPNGFHDAKLVSLAVDFIGGIVTLKMNLLYGVPDDPDPEEYRTGVLRITGMQFCSIDPPDPNYSFAPSGKPLWVSGDPAKDSHLLGLEKLL